MSHSTTSTSWIDAVAKLYTTKQQADIAKINAKSQVTTQQVPITTQTQFIPTSPTANPIFRQVRDFGSGINMQQILIGGLVIIGLVVGLPLLKDAVK